MKAIFLFFSLLVFCFWEVEGQVPDLPLSFTNKKIAKFKNKVGINYLPQDDRLNKLPKKNSLIISSIGIDVNIDMLSIADRCKINGGYLYIYKIKSLNATSLRLFYKHFFLSEKAYLYVYNINNHGIKRRLTFLDNQANLERLGGKLFGNQIIIEHFEPKNSISKSKIIIDMIEFGK